MDMSDWNTPSPLPQADGTYDDDEAEENLLEEEDIPQPMGKTVAEVMGEAREKIRAFAIDLVGITELHPNNSPSCWPLPYGQSMVRSTKDCLRRSFTDLLNEGVNQLQNDLEELVNCVGIHPCNIGYCKKLDKEGKPSDCRFGYPKDFVGFDPIFEEGQDRLVLTRLKRSVQDPCEGGAKFGFSHQETQSGLNADGNLDSSSQQNVDLQAWRNHPLIIKYIREWLSIWRANIDVRHIHSYEALVKYLVKYVTKPEDCGKAFKDIAVSYTHLTLPTKA